MRAAGGRSCASTENRTLARRVQRYPFMRAKYDGVRLISMDSTDAETFQDFDAVSQAREAVTSDMIDWVIVGRNVTGKYGAVVVLDAIDEVA